MTISEKIEKNGKAIIKPSQFLGFKKYFLFFIITFLLWGWRMDIQSFYQSFYTSTILDGQLYFDLLNTIGLNPQEYKEFFTKTLYEFNPIWIIIIPYFFYILYVFFIIRTHTFLFKKNKFAVKSGVLNVNIDWVEYNTIRDFDIHSPLYLRIFGKNNLVILAEDYSGNYKYLYNMFGIQEHVKDRIEEANKTSEIVSLDVKCLFGLNNKVTAELTDFLHANEKKN